MPRGGVLLIENIDGSGAHYSFSTDQPALPSKIDGNAKSLSIREGGPPIAFYEEPNFGGQHWVAVNSGGVNDLGQIPNVSGNWRDRIRSVKYL